MRRRAEQLELDRVRITSAGRATPELAACGRLETVRAPECRWGSWMLTRTEKVFFAREQELHEAHCLAGTNPLQQSGFGRDACDWERFRRPVAGPIVRDGSFLDIGCANGLLMESVVAWAREDGYRVEPYGLDISEKL